MCQTYLAWHKLMTPKNVSFSDYLCTFAMSCQESLDFCNTMLSDFSDMAKSWAAFVTQELIKNDN